MKREGLGGVEVELDEVGVDELVLGLVWEG